MNILSSTNFKSSVSSVLNKDIKQHGKQFMWDSEDDTAWSSNEGTPQWIAIQFEEPQSISAFTFQFQGGFAGKDATIRVESADGRVLIEETFYPDDVNSVQNFKLKSSISEREATKVKFVFGSSTDFFGRIIVYKLEIFS